MTYLKNIFSVRNFLFAASSVFFLASCQQEQELAQMSNDAQVAEAAATGSNVPSLTITGENTNFVGAVDNNTCTYFIDATTKVVDGNELGLKPGDVICLDAAVKYSSLEFVNLIGSADAPITIGTANKN
jgi:hypothetical protein